MMKPQLKRYKLKFYNSGGYKDSAIIETAYVIKQHSPGQYSLYDNGQIIGDEDLLEALLNESRGWVEEYCIIKVERI